MLAWVCRIALIPFVIAARSTICPAGEMSGPTLASPSVVPSVMRNWLPAALRVDERVAVLVEMGAAFGRLFFLVTLCKSSFWSRLKYGLMNSHSSESLGLSTLSTPVCGCGTLSVAQLYARAVRAFGEERYLRKPYMLSCRTKLEKLECLKKRGSSSLPNRSWSGTSRQRTVTSADRVSSPKNESPDSDQ